MDEPAENKVRGTYYESLFRTECLNRGFNVSVPEGDYLGYDVIVESKGGLLRTCQVKGTRSLDPSNRWAITLNRGSGRKKPLGQVDFLAAYVDYPDVRSWYVIPRAEIGNVSSIKLYPANPNSRGRFESYRHAFHLLG